MPAEPDPQQIVHDTLIGGLEALAAVALPPAAAVAAAAGTPALVGLLVGRARQRVDVMRRTAINEIERRDAAGQRPRADLHDDPASTAEELLEGTVLRAAEAYEQRKAPHLGYFLAEVLYDADQDLGEAFWQLEVVRDLTYHQLLLLRALEIGEQDPARARLPDKPFGDRPPQEVAELMLPLHDLIGRGLVHEQATDDPTPEVGSLTDRYGGTHIRFASPASLRLSGAGGRLARNLGLARLTHDNDVEAVLLRLRATEA